MLRNEVEALLKLEDSRFSIKLYPIFWDKRYRNLRSASATKANGRFYYWKAILVVDGGMGVIASAGLTNHEAANNLYKHYSNLKAKRGNN